LAATWQTGFAIPVLGAVSLILATVLGPEPKRQGILSDHVAA
jgi:hypothetical protein